MNHVVRIYEDAFREHGDSPRSVLWPKGRQDERFNALTRHIRRTDAFSVLDYGCGLGHLKPFLEARYRGVSYAGADAVAPFVEACRSKYPDSAFFHGESPAAVPGRFDYVVASGVFNIRYEPDAAAHRARVFDMLAALLDKANVYLAVDFMTDAVDYQQDGAYHQNVVELYRFVSGRLSRRLVLDQSYMPFEYAVTIWNDQRVKKPELVYE